MNKTQMTEWQRRMGIAEMNLFLPLAPAGLSLALFGKRLIPIGTVLDPLVARGLDALT